MAQLKAKQGLKAKTNLKSSTALPTPSTPLRQTQGLRKSKTAIKPSTKPKKPTLPSISKLKREADKWFSLATRYRFAELKGGQWAAQCLTCSVPVWKPIKHLQCGHFMSRAHNNTRYSEENTGPQCYGCNVMQQGKQYAFGVEIDRLYGEGTAKRLYKEAKEPLQFKREYLEEIIADSKRVVKYYESQL